MTIPDEIRARVSRETSERLRIYVEELIRWQPAVQLVAPSTLSEVWTRHIDDSLQLGLYAPAAVAWLDLGAGGGLPGLVLAAENPARRVTLVESDARKCAFLRHVARRAGISARVVERRIEAAVTDIGPVEVVTSRALARLVKLLAYARPWLSDGAVGLFPKGKSAASELTEAAESWRFEADASVSRTDPNGRIVRITRFSGPR